MENGIGQVRERTVKNGKDEQQEEQECNCTYTFQRGHEYNQRRLEGKDCERGEKL